MLIADSWVNDLGREYTAYITNHVPKCACSAFIYSVFVSAYTDVKRHDLDSIQHQLEMLRRHYQSERTKSP
jgi:hypothetical protein